jgi:signal transduction histidine kinase
MKKVYFITSLLLLIYGSCIGQDELLQHSCTRQGTGLGLSLSYEIVKAHGGELSVGTPLEKVETREGAGTTLIIELPILL